MTERPAPASDALAGPQFSGTVDFDLLDDLGISAEDYARFTRAAEVVEKPPPSPRATGKRRREEEGGGLAAAPRASVVAAAATPTATLATSRPASAGVALPSEGGSSVARARPVASPLSSASPPASELPGSCAEAPALHAEHCGGESSDFEEALVGEVCNALAEENRTSVRLAVQALGLRGARRLFDDTLRAEEEGGMRTADGNRRRSPGGVFFELLKGRVDKDTYKEIFAHQAKAHNARINARRQRDRAHRSMSLGVAPTPGAMAGFKFRPPQ